MTLSRSNISKALCIGIFILNSTGCAVSYYSPEDSTYHLYGFGHLKMKVPEDSGQTVYQQIDSYGLMLGTNREGGQFSLGYSQNTIVDVSNDSGLCFEWPSSDLFEIKISNHFPLNRTQGCSNE